MDEKELEREVLRNIRSASTLTSVGLLGLFFPPIAWVCCGIAIGRLSDAKMLLQDNIKLSDKYFDTVKNKASNASFLILLTVMITFAWLFYTFGI